MHYILFSQNKAILESWRFFFGQSQQVSIQGKALSNLNCDAIVSPANSFGFMDGGLDYAITEYLGQDVSTKLQKQISQLEEGELLVGKALVVNTDFQPVPYLISAPTMRIPTSFNISTSVNAYLAMKAALVAAKKHPNIQTVAIPSLCTGSGNMDYKIAARQMFIAFQEIELNQKIKFRDFHEAKEYHQAINPIAQI